MLLRVAVLVFSFLATMQFPNNETISSIIWKKYNGEFFKTIRKFEEVDYENIILNFLKFRLANKDLLNFVTNRKCQQSFLQAEIKNKKSHLRTLQNELNRMRGDLEFSLNCINSAHIPTIFHRSNNNLLKTQVSIHQKIFNKLLKPKGILMFSGGIEKQNRVVMS